MGFCKLYPQGRDDKSKTKGKKNKTKQGGKFFTSEGL